MYHFEGGSGQRVLEELVAYQNVDGGFGNGLEPDLRCQQSSALNTTVALQLLSQLDAPNKEEVIARSLQYFVDSYKQKLNGWEIIPPESDNAPRAIWWNYAPQTATWGNPNAEIIACCYLYSHLLNQQFKERISSLLHDSIHYLQKSCTRNEMHELFCYLRLYEVLSTEQRQNISQEINQFLENCVV